MRPLTIALSGKSLVAWGGGVDFLRNCANALLLLEERSAVRTVLLLPKETFCSRLERYAKPVKGMAKDVLSLKWPRFHWDGPVDMAAIVDSFRNLNGNLSIIEYADSPSGLRQALRETGADVLMPVTESLGTSFDIPWVGYVPDVQHRYLPQYVTPIGRRIRDMKIRKLLGDTASLIVNSRSAADDLQNMYGCRGCKIFTLPFSPLPVEGWFVDNWNEMKRKYSLPDRFFMVSNQFWVHKSHVTALEALAKIVTRCDVHLVCTGKPGDARAPDYYDGLLRKVRELSIESRVHFLGYIAKNDQIQIMKKTLAIIQPTLFEGGPGGGAVYDAVALGVPTIVSDIPVNREIDEEGVIFFAAGSAAELAEQMETVLVNGPRAAVPIEQLREIGRIRAEKLGEVLLEAAEYVANAGCKTGPR